MEVWSLIPAYFILGWSASEVGWSPKLHALNNYFNYHGPGDVKPCPGSYGCYTSFYDAAFNALMDRNRYFYYDGIFEPSVWQILMSAGAKTGSISQAFQAVANAGDDRGNSNYGENALQAISIAVSVVSCLASLGVLRY